MSGWRAAKPSGEASARQPDRHDQVLEVVLLGTDQSGAERADQTEVDLVRLDRLDPVAQELRVEADLQRLAGERGRHRLASLAEILSLDRDRQLALGEAQAKRQVALR